ncbi:Holliday junction resolvase RecU [Aneurinibacillus sp. Ricciae_BoGa-3]|uniref:Holliday junction resolvase RecU n=1 Tax=Aneurinibacillus sp. Ricciae_BoGa-3 TaxID=3022697 RepID=UPI00233FD993|nr:Holliday junction resolvase RecU [Aneurinibacillus sp. Ricciae_BoGa-3]WCK55744.1 Holliday junction resolvase RecU [Aneurinibacillus sp. Ricciae_BoGa-3]
MAKIHYPNGKKNQSFASLPDRMKAEEFLGMFKKNSSAAGRGMSLEEDVNETNAFYVSNEIASVHKKPTPVQIVKVDYPNRSAAVIREAYFRQPSTTDYNGIYEGRHLDFEAKETANKTALPLSNFHEHQIKHMGLVCRHKGISFAIIRFTCHNETYLLDAGHIISFWEQADKGGRKSIPYTYIKEYGHLIPLGLHPRLDYLKVIREHY